jgi:hypothetical protein
MFIATSGYKHCTPDRVLFSAQPVNINGFFHRTSKLANVVTLTPCDFVHRFNALELPRA